MQMKRISWLMIPILLVTIHAGISQNPKYPPTNDLASDSSLAQFITRLKKAVAEKDVKYVISVLDKKVGGGFDTEGGIDAFVETWELKNDSTFFWGFLSRALDLSGAYVNDPHDETGRYEVVFPYLYNFEPALEDDYFALGCITGQHVNLRADHDTKAKVVTQLSYDVIWFLYEDPSGETQYGTNVFGEPEWYLVETYDHAYKGWVFWKYVYSMVGPRLFLYKNPKGKWLISFFVVGD